MKENKVQNWDFVGSLIQYLCLPHVFAKLIHLSLSILFLSYQGGRAHISFQSYHQKDRHDEYANAKHSIHFSFLPELLAVHVLCTKLVKMQWIVKMTH